MRLPLMLQSFGDVRNAWEFDKPSNVSLSTTKITQITDSYGGKTISQATDSRRPTYTIQQNGNNVASFNNVASQSLQASTIADWNFLHDGTDYTIVTCSKSGGDSTLLCTSEAAGNGMVMRSWNADKDYYLAIRNAGANVVQNLNESGSFNTTWNIFRSTIYILKPTASPVSGRSKGYFDGFANSYTQSANGTADSGDANASLMIGGRPEGGFYLSGTMGLLALMNGQPYLAPERLGTFLKMKWGN